MRQNIRAIIICTAWVLLFSACALTQGSSNPRPRTSATYSETIAKLKDWSRHCCVEQDNSRFAWLFAEGETRKTDLRQACKDPDAEVRRKAFQLLQVLGDPACILVERPSEKFGSRLVGWAAPVRETDFVYFERILATRPCETTRTCKEDQLPEINDSFVYGLILDGSVRAQVLLRRVYALRRIGAAVAFAPETESEALSLIADARKAREGLGLIPTLDSMRATAFYISRKYRKDAAVSFLAHSPDGNRMLVRVSYTCGMLCGEGYELVLQRFGSGWRYLFVAMEWTS